jgi:hypothetical protein
MLWRWPRSHVRSSWTLTIPFFRVLETLTRGRYLLN